MTAHGEGSNEHVDEKKTTKTRKMIMIMQELANERKKKKDKRDDVGTNTDN